ncbi:dienelactone hydrolase [Flavobacterium sp. PL11]|nr:dienelactone hydrolase [Flavobacterium sp. PL11]
MALDALSPLAGNTSNDDTGREFQKKRNREEMLEDFVAAYEFLKSHKNCNGQVGVVGFCFGGWIANMMAVRIPTLKAAVPYYGGQPTAAEAEKITTPSPIHYAGLDTRVNEGWPFCETIINKNKVENSAFI